MVVLGGQEEESMGHETIGRYNKRFPAGGGPSASSRAVYSDN